jgi:hypothetical protein
MLRVAVDQLQIFSFCDPASGRQQIRRARARSAIVTVGMDSINRFFVLNAFAARPHATELREKVIAIGERFHHRRFGIEANAMQSLFADLVQSEARKLNKKIPFMPVNQPTKIDKDWRIRTILQPIIANGQLFIQEDQLELKSEITSFPMSATKDLVDALASAIMLAPRFKNIARERSDEIESLAKYLRDSGASPSVIEQRVKELTYQIEQRTAPQQNA